MKKQSCKKRRSTRLSSHSKSKKKKQVKKQNRHESSASQKITQNKSQLPVTCGYKEGVLYLKKYSHKQKCIFSEEQWFKPTEFERFGMKEKNKKWRTSILCKGIPLQNLIEDGFLPATNFKKSSVQDAKKKKSHVGLKKQESHEKVEDNQVSDDDDAVAAADDAVDMSVFEDPVLPVTCGSHSGSLHKYRFSSGSCGRCIRTENSWLTPEDFSRLSKPDGIWKKHIVSHGMPLGKLITKSVLEPHAANCDCGICQEPDQNLKNDDMCFVCDSEGDLVCCDDCPRAFHSRCHIPAVNEDLPGKWSCTFCVMKNVESFSQNAQQDVWSSPVSQYTLHCQYLLLHLLRESKTDPCNNVSRHSENICGPMMLGRVKRNLENNDCKTVQEFINDIEYVFHLCTANRDNDFNRMTSRLKELLETVFKPL
ncbi:nuclear body protein SP140-like protein isoform X2 [Garra rufa]|uniref:nuclear body protein SP140-like protein isoform X2 n=1 Tax=Garra rufa TaxID=137080 RepID=UPI003CCE546D